MIKISLSALLTAICHCLLKLGIIQLMIFAALYTNYKLKTAVQASCRMILASADAACIVYIWQKTEEQTWSTMSFTLSLSQSRITRRSFFNSRS